MWIIFPCDKFANQKRSIFNWYLLIPLVNGINYVPNYLRASRSKRLHSYSIDWLVLFLWDQWYNKEGNRMQSSTLCGGILKIKSPYISLDNLVDYEQWNLIWQYFQKKLFWVSYTKISFHYNSSKNCPYLISHLHALTSPCVTHLAKFLLKELVTLISNNLTLTTSVNLVCKYKLFDKLWSLSN